MGKRGQVWVSAALYTALGIILVTLILSVGMPFVNKLKERNTVLQTKNVMYDFDKVIRTVNNEGYGSRRPIFLDIGEGDFEIRADNAPGEKNRIQWSFQSEEKLGIEPGVDIEEGNLNIRSEQLGQGYEIKLYLDYDEDNIQLKLKDDARTKVLSGKYNLVVEHKLSGSTSYIEIREQAG